MYQFPHNLRSEEGFSLNKTQRVWGKWGHKSFFFRRYFIARMNCRSPEVLGLCGTSDHPVKEKNLVNFLWDCCRVPFQKSSSRLSMSLQLVSGHHDYIHTSGMEEFQWMRRTEKKNSKVDPAETFMFLLKILILLQKHFKSWGTNH